MMCITSGRFVTSIIILAMMIASLTHAAEDHNADPFKTYVQQQSQSILGRLETTGDFTLAKLESDRLFHKVVTYAVADDVDSFHTAAYVRRLVHQLQLACEHMDAVAYIRNSQSNDDLSTCVAFLIKPEDQIIVIYRMLEQFQAEFDRRLNDYANLAAAVCVVHDQQLMRWINENFVQAPTPLEIMKFYLQYEQQMLFGIKTMPAELLVYVVDNAASIADMQWAVRKYNGDKNVGRRFFDVRYDYTYYKQGIDKQVTVKGYSLPNIYKYGGVCADQAYFAATVGKSIGVPITYTRGSSGQGTHAWVGFLQVRGGKLRWNFDVGRYDAFKKVQGQVDDPQTRKVIADSVLMLTAMFADTTAYDRQIAVAMLDAATLLGKWENDPDDLDLTLPPQLLQAMSQQLTLRTSGVDQQLALLESGLRHCPAHVDSWLKVAELARDGRFSLEMKQYWWDMLSRMTQDQYPDFVLDMLIPMIESVDNIDAQNAMWDHAFKQFDERPDLAAIVRIKQGLMWQENGQLKRADECFDDVIRRFANDGPFIIKALRFRELILYELDKSKHVPGLYTSTWKRIKRPADKYSEFKKASTWYELGQLCVLKLEEAGRFNEAQKIQRIIDREVGQ